MPDIWYDVDTALAAVPVNIFPLTDDTDFKTREESVVYNQSGLDLVWNFITTGGAFTQTAVTPTESAGDYDWANKGNGMYSIEIPASGGASINNDTEGFGWFTGYATGILPWRGPVCGFRDPGLNNALIDSAYSATRGLAGTALPDAAADAAGGLPVSDAGGLDLDAMNANVSSILTDTNELQTDDTPGALAAIDAKIDTIDGIVDSILEDTAEIGTAGVGLTEAGGDGDHLTEAGGSGDQFTAIPTDAIADAVWDEATSGHVTAGTFGKAAADILADTNELQSDDVPGLIAALNDLDASAVTSAAASALATYDPPTRAELTSDINSILSAVAALNDVSTSDIVTAVLAMAYEASETFQDYLRLSRAVLYGIVSGMESNAPVFVGADESTPRVSATTDANGNRSAVTLDPDS